MNESTHFIAACIQINSGNDLDENIKKVTRFVTDAAKNGAQFITLPENTFFMAASQQNLFDNAPLMNENKGVIALRELAAKLKIWILFATIVRAENTPNMLANRSILIGADGEIKNIYDKIHLFDANVKGDQAYRESENIISGDKAVIGDLPWGKLGMTICYDVRFPILFRSLAKAGALFITVPAAFVYNTGIAHWHSLLKARAIENAAYIIAPGQCGHHPRSRRTYGHSLIVNPWGEIISEASELEEGFITAEIDIPRVLEIRHALPSLKHDKHFEF